ncbi:MAG TPA: SRPBCC domain-containing protein [Vicinamibacterales bacterium]
MTTTKRTHHGRKIEQSIRIKSTPERVWKAWADPQDIANWFVDRAEGHGTAGSTMRWFFDTFGYVMDIPVVESESGRLFVVAGDDGPDGLPYLMEITIAKEGGEVVMNLVNSGFADDPKKNDTFEGTVSGWQSALTAMKVWLENYPLRKRHHDLVVRPAQWTRRLLRELYATREGRAQWMEPDLPSNGEMLCDTGTEVTLSLPGEDGIVAVKAFTMGPQYFVGLDLMVWPEEGAPAQDAKARLNRALDRLVPLIR